MSDLKEIASTYWTPPPELVAKLPRKTKDGKTIHLDYVGHADVNRTLTEIDPDWSWEPLAYNEDGLPRVVVHDGTAELWGRLTLLGKSVLCVGSCDDRKQDRAKELVGDLIRNGAMRHNVYGALWSKAERDGIPERDAPQRRSSGRSAAPANEDGEPLADKEQTGRFMDLSREVGVDSADDRRAFVASLFGKTSWRQVTKTEADEAIRQLTAIVAGEMQLMYDNAGRPFAAALGEPFDVPPLSDEPPLPEQHPFDEPKPAVAGPTPPRRRT